jgi:DNA gyrase subunit A
MVVTVSHQGYIKRNPASLYRNQRRGGKGKMGMTTKEEDFVEHIFIASTHNYILIFTNQGRVYWLKVYQLPQAGRAAKGKAIVNLVNMNPGEKVAAVLPVRAFEDDKFVVMATKKGIIKKTELAAYSNPRTGGIIAISVEASDELMDVKQTNGAQEIFLGTRKGMAIRFKEEDVRAMGRTATGVIGIRMDDDDHVVGMEIPTEGNSIMTVSERGFGKRTEIAEYRLQSRGGKGILNLKTTPRIGLVSGIRQVTGDEDLMLISDSGNIIRIRVGEVPVLHRVTQGVKLIDLAEGENFCGIARAEREGEAKNGEGAAEEETLFEADEGEGEKSGE